MKVVKMCVTNNSFLGICNRRYCIWSKIFLQTNVNSFLNNFDITKFLLDIFFTSAMKQELRFYKSMLAQFLWVLNCIVKPSSTWSRPPAKLYLRWLCSLNLLNDLLAIFIKRIIEYITCNKDSEIFKIYLIIFHFMI